MYDNKFTFIDKVLKHVNKEIYYRDVYVFINRIKNIIFIENQEMLRQNL